MPLSRHGGQRITCESWLSPLTVWLPTIKFRLQAWQRVPFPTEPFCQPQHGLRWLLWFGAEAPGHARDLGPFSPLTEREKVQRDMGGMAQLVSCLMCGHEDPSSISSTHIKKLGVVDGCYHPSIEEAEGRIPPTHRPANLACLASSRPSEKLVS